MVNPVSKEEITLDHILAAEFIQKAFRRFLEFRRINGGLGKPGLSNHSSTQLASTVPIEEDDVDEGASGGFLVSVDRR